MAKQELKCLCSLTSLYLTIFSIKKYFVKINKISKFSCSDLVKYKYQIMFIGVKNIKELLLAASLNLTDLQFVSKAISDKLLMR